MKICNSALVRLAGRSVFFFLTFAVGVAVTALSWSQNLPAAVPLEQASPESPAEVEIQVDELKDESEASIAGPNVVQTSLVDFPISGPVNVRSIEENGKFPQMLFVSQKTGKVLLRSSIEDEDSWLIPEQDSSLSQPELRFRVIRSRGFQGPMIMSVGLVHGGSDNAFYLTVFGEVNGKIVRLNQKPMFANIQGGYYLGYLNKQLGSGLAVWNFIWGGGINEGHYGNHKYEIEIYRLQKGQLKREFRKVSRHMYDSTKGANSLHELGIRVDDQRLRIPQIKDNLE